MAHTSAPLTHPVTVSAIHGWIAETTFYPLGPDAYSIECEADGVPTRWRGARSAYNRPLTWREIARHAARVPTLRLYGDLRRSVHIDIDVPWQREIIVASMLRDDGLGLPATGRFLQRFSDAELEYLHFELAGFLHTQALAELAELQRFFRPRTRLRPPATVPELTQTLAVRAILDRLPAVDYDLLAEYCLDPLPPALLPYAGEFLARAQPHIDFFAAPLTGRRQLVDERNAHAPWVRAARIFAAAAGLPAPRAPYLDPSPTGLAPLPLDDRRFAVTSSLEDPYVSLAFDTAAGDRVEALFLLTGWISAPAEKIHRVMSYANRAPRTIVRQR